MDLIGSNINLHSKARTKEEAILELCDMLEKSGYIRDKKLFHDDVYKREALGLTGMENGIAIPHGESSAALKAGIAVLKTSNPLDWESLDGKPITLVFLLVVPTENRNTAYIKMLGHLAAALAYSDIQKRLSEESDSDKFKEILEMAGGM
ncbi:PTS sugar transporter subunit IIA [Olsenella profusa]|nr:fructose PTS transporter subunit IIA [Olsenella profusa]